MVKASTIFYKKTNKKYVYNINHISNIKLILDKGLLSYNDAIKYNHISFANSFIQLRRNKIYTHLGIRLHDYANCYFNPKNALLYSLKNSTDIVILCISNKVLDIKGTIVSDRNASSKEVHFYNPIKGIETIDFKKVFSNSWNYINNNTKKDIKSIMQSEILIPFKIDVKYIKEIMVSNNKAKKILNNISSKSIKISIDKEIFFK